MKIFLTGAAGFIGSVVAEQLLTQGHEVIGVDNFQEGMPSSVPKGIKFYESDYGDCGLLEKIFRNDKIDCVFHFAAETTVETSMTNPSIYFRNNVVNGLNLLDAMLKHDVYKMVFSSTAAVYGEPVYLPIDEQHAKKPVNSYGASKLMYEEVLAWYHYAYGINYNLFRYFNAAGAGDSVGENRKHESHLLPLVFKAIHDDNFVLNVYGNDYNTKDGTCIRDYIHVKDIAGAHILAMNNLEVHPEGKYNLGSSTGYSILEIIELAEKISAKKVKWQFESRRSGDPASLVASSSLALKELGWNMQHSEISNIIKDAYRWFLNLMESHKINT